ncbi:histidine kinase [Mucilaginibacter sp. PAMB04274]|uniref:sensor histidine kinase n=1 Tax=Mucilaginibacter sp. PAMB04274 TaxID=3138568 RepID=UPI0031F67084
MIAATQNWFRRFKVHILIWTAFILYETVVIGLVFGEFGHPLTYLSHYAIALVLFYVHADVVLPRAVNGTLHVVWRTPLLVAVEIWLYIFACYCIDYALVEASMIKRAGSLAFDTTYQLKTLYRGLLFMGFGTGYYFLKRFLKERERSSALEKEQLREIINRQKFEQQLANAENEFLKAQINPHFLFNTLDFVYHNVLLVSPVAANTIIALSEMVRFAMDASKTGGYILLGDEIEQVDNLIFLNQVRKSDSLSFLFQSDRSVEGLFLIPLVLLTLAENIFKHGELDDPSDPARFTVTTQGDELIIETRNAINLQYVPSRSSGSGLSNISQRLKYAYGDQCSFTHRVTSGSHFEVRITILMDLLRERPSSADGSTGTDRGSSPVAFGGPEIIG